MLAKLLDWTGFIHTPWFSPCNHLAMKNDYTRHSLLMKKHDNKLGLYSTKPTAQPRLIVGDLTKTIWAIGYFLTNIRNNC